MESPCAQRQQSDGWFLGDKSLMSFCFALPLHLNGADGRLSAELERIPGARGSNPTQDGI